ncbi:MAG: hypothetical protein KatS3mg092_0936 [Patescibacteria group bacterium]|nr:MAG: hypothetical protein KatS3mg092_0936 [Patescibacteria group bacterium]
MKEAFEMTSNIVFDVLFLPILALINILNGEK